MKDRRVLVNSPYIIPLWEEISSWSRCNSLCTKPAGYIPLELDFDTKSGRLINSLGWLILCHLWLIVDFIPKLVHYALRLYIETYCASSGSMCTVSLYRVLLSPYSYSWHLYHLLCSWNMLWFGSVRRCESPQVPFSIFTSRFRTPPKAIVYDNACNLQVYCLNREPALYKSTCFFIDHFHWRGHVGCLLVSMVPTWTTD